MADLNTTTNNTLKNSHESSVELVEALFDSLTKKERDALLNVIGAKEFDLPSDECLYKAIEILQSHLQFSDDRQSVKVKYPIQLMVMIIIIGWLCGERSALSLERFVGENYRALKRIIPGFEQLQSLPSHDTFLYILSNLVFEDLEAFIFQFSRTLLYTSQINYPEELQYLAADGQCVNGARENVENEHQRKYFLTLYNTKEKLSIKQATVSEKENEIPVFREMIKGLDLNNCLITVDALHTNLETLKAIREQNGYSLMQIKENQKTLHQRAEVALSTKTKSIITKTNVSVENSKIVEREITITTADKLLLKSGTESERNKINIRVHDWAEQCTYIYKIIKTCTPKQQSEKHSKKTVVEISYGITDIPAERMGDDIAQFLLDAKRRHWSIENSLHWSLDVNLSQDSSFKIKNKTLLQNCVLLNKLVDNVASCILNKRKTLDRQTLKKIGGTSIVSKKAVLNKMHRYIDDSVGFLLYYILTSGVSE